MIHEEICTYEVCKLAKEKGFDEYEACNHIYEDDEQWHTLTTYTNAKGIDWSKDKFAVAPAQGLLQRWLREERGVIVEVFVDDDSNMPLTYNIHQYKDCNWECVCHHHGNYYAVNDWELCLEDALKYALENLV